MHTIFVLFFSFLFVSFFSKRAGHEKNKDEDDQFFVVFYTSSERIEHNTQLDEDCRRRDGC